MTNFHLTLARCTSNPIFSIILRVLMELTVRTMTPPTVSLERLKKHASSHRSVYDTLRNRDLAGARRAMEEHMLEVENRYADKARHEDGGEGQA